MYLCIEPLLSFQAVMVHIAQMISLLGCYTMQNNNSVLMFWKKVLHGIFSV